MFELHDLPSSRSANPTAPRPRRRPGEVRRLLLDAARQVFEEKGYAGATTREITIRAGVAETLLFRNFGSKANLFAEAVLLPLADFFRGWVLRFTEEELPSADAEVNQYEFTKTLYEMASANRGLLLTFFGTAVFEPEVYASPDAVATISQALDDLAATSADDLERRGVDLQDYDVVVRSRAVVGMILAMALFETISVPLGDQARTQDDVIRELTRQILFGGFNERPKSLDTSTPSRPISAATAGARRPKDARKPIKAAAALRTTSQKK